MHNGHIHLAQAVMEELSLDRIFFVPSKISPHRSIAEYASGEDRVNMLRLACEGIDGFEVSDYELRNERVSYSVYTVEHFRSNFPEDELFLLVGSDMLLSFDKWYRFEDILKNVTLSVCSREDGDFEALKRKAEELALYGKIEVCTAPPVMVSSTEIRKNFEKNQDLSCYLNENVVQYIRLRGLFGCKTADEVS